MKYMTKNIWAVGRNYIDHAKEMNATIPNEPLLFLKAGSTLTFNQKIIFPKWSKDIHHELEIALLIDENLKFSHMSLALDLTARDKQAEAKKNGTPWTLSKSFTGACPIGAWHPVTDLKNVSFMLIKNGHVVQSAKASEMIFSADVLLDYVKSHFPVCKNDILLTGTPAGVGPLASGDILEALILNTDDAQRTPILTCHWNVE
jgi:2-keto-4-pentenoate hydratase/2-oxohepta-3-ene-1,7-dioic acid hydratase in catechol pathway